MDTAVRARTLAGIAAAILGSGCSGNAGGAVTSRGGQLGDFVLEPSRCTGSIARSATAETLTANFVSPQAGPRFHSIPESVFVSVRRDAASGAILDQTVMVHTDTQNISIELSKKDCAVLTIALEARPSGAIAARVTLDCSTPGGGHISGEARSDDCR